MRFLVFLLFATQLSAQWSFTRYYSVNVDSLGALSISEHDTLGGGIATQAFPLDGTIRCVNKWIKETTNFDEVGVPSPSIVEVLPPATSVTINALPLTKPGSVFAGTALMDIEFQTLNFYTLDSELATRVLTLFTEKPCRQLVARRINVDLTTATTYPAYWFPIGQPIVNVEFGN